MRVGSDVYISNLAVFRRPHLVEMGDHVAIDDFVVVTTALKLGSHVHISPSVSVIGGEWGRLVVGDFCTIAAGCRIICRGDSFDGTGLVSAPGIPEELKNTVYGVDIIMKNFSSLGTNVILHSDVHIAEGVFVNSGSIVTKPIGEPWTKWQGIPAKKYADRPREKMIEYARKLGFDYE